MFEWLFKYPRDEFTHGEFVFASTWPQWVLIAAFAVGAAAILYFLVREREMGAGRLAARLLRQEDTVVGRVDINVPVLESRPKVGSARVPLGHDVMRRRISRPLVARTFQRLSQFLGWALEHQVVQQPP